MTEYDGKKFHNRTLELDGNVFRNCHFINCQFRFRGRERFAFENNRYEGAFWLELLEDWRTMPDALDPLRSELRRYGADLDKPLNPREEDWASRELYLNFMRQREYSINWWFQREGKPAFGLTLVDPADDGPE